MKVLLIHASFGAGHRRAAEALREAFEHQGIAVEAHDLLEFLLPVVGGFYSFAYKTMITHSRTLWRLTYEIMDRSKAPYSPANSVSQRWQFARLKEFLQNSDFTHVLSTHYTPSALLADWKSSGVTRATIFSVVTDYEAHRCWKRKELDHYFVATDFVAGQLRDTGVPAGKISVTGIPISASFSTCIERRAARNRWNFEEQHTVILALCSALTLKKSIELLEEIRSVAGDLRFLVGAGSDPIKEERLKRHFRNEKRFMIFGFSSAISEMMSAADLVITKPGGLIISESLAMGLPQILLDPIPGQEEANARYSSEQKAAVCVSHAPGIYRKTLAVLLADPDRLLQMRTAALRAGRPRAAEEIVAAVKRATTR